MRQKMEATLKEFLNEARRVQSDMAYLAKHAEHAESGIEEFAAGWEGGARFAYEHAEEILSELIDVVQSALDSHALDVALNVNEKVKPSAGQLPLNFP